MPNAAEPCKASPLLSSGANTADRAGVDGASDDGRDRESDILKMMTAGEGHDSQEEKEDMLRAITNQLYGMDVTDMFVVGSIDNKAAQITFNTTTHRQAEDVLKLLTQVRHICDLLRH